MEKLGGGGALLAWLTTAASPQITMEIHISDWTHMFHNNTGLNAKSNSELYKSNRFNSAGRYTGATTDYIEEKRKTEELLYELLPRYILCTGATTDYLEEKRKTEELLYELLPRYILDTGAHHRLPRGEEED